MKQTRICFRVGDRTIKLTPAEARQLRAELNELFAEAFTFTPHVHYDTGTTPTWYTTTDSIKYKFYSPEEK